MGAPCWRCRLSTCRGSNFCPICPVSPVPVLFLGIDRYRAHLTSVTNFQLITATRLLTTPSVSRMNFLIFSSQTCGARPRGSFYPHLPTRLLMMNVRTGKKVMWSVDNGTGCSGACRFVWLSLLRSWHVPVFPMLVLSLVRGDCQFDGITGRLLICLPVPMGFWAADFREYFREATVSLTSTKPAEMAIVMPCV